MRARCPAVHPTVAPELTCYQVQCAGCGVTLKKRFVNGPELEVVPHHTSEDGDYCLPCWKNGRRGH